MIDKLSYVGVCTIVTCFKVLFLNTYVSTDFDVHRNWLAITANLPLKQWYVDETSEWTLDYPPLFAFFEYLIAFVLPFVIPSHNLRLSKNAIRNADIIKFHKNSVIASDVLYYYAVYKLVVALKPCLKNNNSHTAKQSKKPQQQQLNKNASNELTQKVGGSNCSLGIVEAFEQRDKATLISLLLLLQPGLFLVDHIHFQYNGFLMSFLLLSLASIFTKNYITAAVWFSILLNLKHIYLYVAPAYGVYLFSTRCLSKISSNFKQSVLNFIKLAITVVTIFIITYAPFVDSIDSFKQILARLFPFKRGLTHAYWAPNVWTIYNVIEIVLSKYGPSGNESTVHLVTRGIIGEFKFKNLPQITPVHTLILVLIFSTPFSLKLLLTSRKANPIAFLKCLVLASLTSFLFGWHVHEKAILMALMPLIPASFLDTNLKSALSRITLAGTYSLFPLLFEPKEYIIKITLLMAYYPLLSYIPDKETNLELNRKSFSRRIYELIDKFYLLGFICIELLINLTKMEFLPLLVTSLYCALGIVFSYVELYVNFLLN